MTFVQIMAFAAVAKHRNITKAAQTLRVSQPSVSKHLKSLEEIYGVKLFERNGREMELTEEGRVCLRRVHRILFHLDRLKGELIPKTFLKSETLKLAGSYAASARILPSVIATFQRKFNDVRIVLRTGSTNIVKAMMLHSEVEFAVLNEKPSSPNLDAEVFREEELVIFAAPNHPLATKGKLVPADLSEVIVVATGGKGRLSTTEKILQASAHTGVKVRIGIRCGTPEAVKAVVQKGIGVGILFADTVGPEIRKGVFKPLHFRGLKLRGYSYIVRYKDRPLSTLGGEFLALLRQTQSKQDD